MENFYSDGSPNQIAEATGVPVVKVPVYVYGIEGVDSYLDLMDYIIKRIAENT
jgi:phosphoribosylcarboxyaminoimidazole (NCAIR) mutase